VCCVNAWHEVAVNILFPCTAWCCVGTLVMPCCGSQAVLAGSGLLPLAELRWKALTRWLTSPWLACFVRGLSRHDGENNLEIAHDGLEYDDLRGC
jgi:hypothetical protein